MQRTGQDRSLARFSILAVSERRFADGSQRSDSLGRAEVCEYSLRLAAGEQPRAGCLPGDLYEALTNDQAAAVEQRPRQRRGRDPLVDGEVGSVERALDRLDVVGQTRAGTPRRPNADAAGFTTARSKRASTESWVRYAPGPTRSTASMNWSRSVGTKSSKR